MKDKSRNILIYGGTTEGRRLAEELCRAGFACHVCVATGYGENVLDRIQGLTVYRGRMEAEEMSRLTEKEDFLAVVDATHPFARQVSENIRESLKGRSIPYLRLKRQTKAGEKGWEHFRRFPDAESCAAALQETEGNILLTTGSKELPAFVEKGLGDRLYVRILPAVESLKLCEEQGIRGRQVIAMQGPFSEAMNRALIAQFAVRCLVTKESGEAGGFYEKLQAAKQAGIMAYVIGSPEEDSPGLDAGETIRRIYMLAGREKEPSPVKISLIGVGMGEEGLLTVQAGKRLEEAEVIFGSGRLLEGKYPGKVKFPYYRPEDILPKLKELKEARTGELRAAVLFSGDTGFYSGAKRLYRELEQMADRKELKAQTELLPGIASIACLAAKAGISWEDAEIISIHGRKEDIVRAVEGSRKVFLLLSGAEDMRRLGELFCREGMTDLVITAGIRLSYPEEQIRRLKPAECRELSEEGPCCCFIENHKAGGRRVTHGMPDGLFVRGNVPMTKEETRDISVCKLELTKDAVLYDIGSGTGSVAVECARLSREIQVYAIERKKEAVELIQNNVEKFRTANVRVIEAQAPDGLEGLPIPSHAFIGGSGGRLREILMALYKKNPSMRVVVSAVTLETAGGLASLLREFPLEREEILQVQVSRAQKTGDYHLMKAENPVYVAAFTFKEG